MGLCERKKSPSPLHGAPRWNAPTPGSLTPCGVRSPGATRPSSLRDSDLAMQTRFRDTYKDARPWPPHSERDSRLRMPFFNTLSLRARLSNATPAPPIQGQTSAHSGFGCFASPARDSVSAMFALIRFLRMAAAAAAVWFVVIPVQAEAPYPKCDGCPNPRDYSQYLFLKEGVLPNDYSDTSAHAWKYKPLTGLNILAAWRFTTGRPDVVSAVLDSGIRWENADLAAKVALNTGELPLPAGCASYDCNNDGVVNVHDFPGRDRLERQRFH